MLMYLCVIGIKNRKPQLLDIKSIAVLLCDSAAIRTQDPRLRRALLYPAELNTLMERVVGIEPTFPAWKAGVLPIYDTRKW